jgi:hypothetical protein
MVPACSPREAGPTPPDGSAAPRAGAPSPEGEEPGGPLAFRARELPFVYQRGASGAKWPVEVTGGGLALIDFDGDGDLDLFFAQGGPLPFGSKPSPPADVLLRNDGKGTFVDVSAEVGLAPRGYGQGLAAADYDADGDVDVYVTRYGKNTLWRNEGGRFVDATDEAGVGCELWSLGAAFLDFDGDGDLDLFVANYFDFDPADAPFARLPDGSPEYGPPETFAGQPDVLYRNDGSGHFEDVTGSAGVAGDGRGMGVLAADLDGDGRIDILVANDAMPNAAWVNRGDGTFAESATALGLDLNGEGQPEANMGIAFEDLDGDALRDVFITHYVGEHDTLWRALAAPDGRRLYHDATFAAGLGQASRPLTGWGVAAADFDLDGRPDLLIANGHIRPEPNQRYDVANPPLLWHNRGDGKFADVTAQAGEYFRTLHEGRGLAVGDLDADGDLDVVITHLDAPAVVLWNESPRRGHWLMLDLQGAGGNRDAIGATVRVEAGGKTFVSGVDGGGGYLSVNDRRLFFGLGEAERIDRVEVRWPSGRVETREDVPVDRVVRWREGEGTGLTPRVEDEGR